MNIMAKRISTQQHSKMIWSLLVLVIFIIIVLAILSFLIFDRSNDQDGSEEFIEKDFFVGTYEGHTNESKTNVTNIEIGMANITRISFTLTWVPSIFNMFAMD